jgi:2-methylcitrate dehydratase PrpD
VLPHRYNLPLRVHTTVPIESIAVSLSPICWNIIGPQKPNKIRPENIVDAQFSNYIQTATAWLHGSDIGWASYDKIYDPGVLGLSARVRCISDSNVANLAAKFTVRWQDGAEKEETLDAPLGEPSNHFSIARVQDKFLSLTRSVYGNESAIAILNIIEDLDRHSIADLVFLLK